MIPDLNQLKALFLLLLPGFLTLKIRGLFYPPIPSQKQDVFDKTASYFVFSLLSYLTTLLFLEVPSDLGDEKIYMFGTIAIISAIALGLIMSALQFIIESNLFFSGLWGKLDSVVPFRGSIWHRVFNLERKRFTGNGKKTIVKVLITMKNTKKVYVGEINLYPLENNTSNRKDFLIKGVTVFRPLGEKTTYPPEYGVLLNQRDVESIVYNYNNADNSQHLKK